MSKNRGGKVTSVGRGEERKSEKAIKGGASIGGGEGASTYERLERTKGMFLFIRSSKGKSRGKPFKSQKERFHAREGMKKGRTVVGNAGTTPGGGGTGRTSGKKLKKRNSPRFKKSRRKKNGFAY